MLRKRWNAKERDLLKKLAIEKGESLSRVASHLGRTEKAILCELDRMHLKPSKSEIYISPVINSFLQGC